MRQVPKYAVIGNGKVARHFCHYFNLLQLPYLRWWRGCPVDLSTVVSATDHILLLISDAAIVPFINDHPILQNKTILHFSGSLVTSLAPSAHPLMMFSEQLYSLAVYKKIPFILEQEGPVLSELLPGFENQSYYIPRALKPFYHSLCVLSGNFTCRLWQKFFTELETTLNLPKKVGYLYLEQIMQHLRHNLLSAPFGPLARKDSVTIEANLKALSGDPFQKIYQAFLKEAGYDYKCS